MDPLHQISFFARDSPPRALVFPLLHGEENYHSWARQMKQALQSKNMWHVVDGSLRPPFWDDRAEGVWTRSNKRVVGWITQSIDESIRPSILIFNNASDVWIYLHDRYSLPDMVRILHLQEEIFQRKQGLLSVKQYYQQFMTLWEDMESLRPAIIVCQCSTPCACGAVLTCKIYRDQDCVLQFLKGLNEKFADVRDQLLRFNPFPQITDVVKLLLQQEEFMANAVSSVSESFDGNAGQSERFEKFERRRRGNGSRANRSCTYSAKNSHTGTSAYRKSSDNNAHAFINVDTGPTSYQTTAPIRVVGFTQAQYQGIVNLLEKAGQGFNSSYYTASDSSI